MKKFLLILCLLLALTCLFVACDEGGDQTPEDGEHTHVFGDWSVTKEATCAAKGEQTRTCSCGESETQEIPMTAHTFGAWQEVTAPTCANGKQERTCACGEVETGDIPAIAAHNYGVDNRCTLCHQLLLATDGLAYTLNSDGESYTVKKGTALNNSTDIVIPWYYNEKPVTIIGEYAFEDCENLTSITIPASVTSIGEGAFYWCDSLTSITIPEGSQLTSIGEEAFYWCDSLTSITIPEGVTSIGKRAFQYCGSLTNINIPENVTSIGEGTFQYCSSLKSVTIPDGITSISHLAFTDCSSLESVTIPESITFIGWGAFNGCSLEYNEYDNGLYLGNEDNPYLVLVRAKNTSITSCEINSKTRIILEYAFEGCYSLENITIPEGITFIAEYAFRGCHKLEYNEYDNGL